MSNDNTSIGWCDATWNPITGCSKVSEGCRNCYAAALAPRLAAMGQKGYTTLPWTARNAAQNVMLHPDRLEMPLRWRKPRRVFVNSMSDLFHEQVPDEFIWRVFGIMARARAHTFQILTKRPERMAEFCSNPDWYVRLVGGAVEATPGDLVRFADVSEWPLPNVQLGTSIENQPAADERLSHLRRMPAALLFLSCEPLLGPLDLGAAFVCECGDYVRDHAPGGGPCQICAKRSAPYDNCEEWRLAPLQSVGWVIAGGESGPNFRPMDEQWARDLRDQCVAAGVPFFFKQHSGLRPASKRGEPPTLDGEVWHQFPEEVVVA